MFRNELQANGDQRTANVDRRIASLMLCAFAVVVFCATVFGQRDRPRFGDGAWIFLAQRGSLSAAPTAVFSGRLSGSQRVRLDGARYGTLRVQHEPCSPPQRCSPIDCGCLEVDRYRLSIVDERGGMLPSTELWAAYGVFEIVPVDLIDGPGDELLIVRRLGRSAPPNGMDLKVLQIDGPRVRELLPSHQIAGNLSGTPMVCGQWRSRVTVDMASEKPRTLSIKTTVTVPTGCTLDEPMRAASLDGRMSSLRFLGGRYVEKP